MKQSEYDAIMASRQYSADLKKWLATRDTKVIRGITVLRREDLEGGQVFHISPDPSIKRFVPMIGTRQGKTEDRTTARVCVSANLIDCLAGFAATFQNAVDEEIEPKKGWRGGYYIYQFSPDYVFAVDKNLVYDASFTNELWLTAYDDSTASYDGNVIGKVWMKEFTVRFEKDRVAEVTWYLELKKPAVVFPGVGNVGVGYHTFRTIGKWRMGWLPNPVKGSLREITREEYLEAKSGLLDTLSWSGW